MKHIVLSLIALAACSAPAVADEAPTTPVRPVCEVSAFYATFLTAGWFDWSVTPSQTLDDCVADARAELGRIVNTPYYGAAIVKVGKFRYTAGGYVTEGSVKAHAPGRRGD
jgi:hypothetical protein